MNPKLTYYNLSDRVTAFSTTRQGGFSVGSYASFNANAYCGDDAEHVACNRELLRLKLQCGLLVIPHQVHGDGICVVDADYLRLTEAEQAGRTEGIDALLTNETGICIGVSTADCTPIIIYDPEHHAAAVAHAGWRGTVARIAEKTMARMQSTYGSRPEQLLAVIGPCISVKNFEVGDEVYDAFASEGFPMSLIARREEKWHIDLPLCNEWLLTSMGVPGTQIHQTALCTYDQCDRYFSARRLGIHSGRIYSGIVLR